MIGKVIADYEIIEKIGQGGMGEVYKAIHTKLEQTVAVKVLSSEYSLDPSMRRRFVNEAKIQAKFSHPNVVNIFNLIEQDSNVFIIMEYISGDTLEKHLEKKGVLSEDESVKISLQVLSALQFMHSRGVVHRDIKPSNIMFTDTGAVKVTDFGIAKVMNEKTKHTKTGMLGSVAYVSPEQILGEETSITTDIYSFGITLYKMVTGRAPFTGNSEFVVMQGHLKQKPVPPVKFNENISIALNKTILKSISKDPEKRYASVFELIESLKNLSSREGVLSTVSYYLNDKMQAVSGTASRNMIVLLLGFLLSAAVLNFAIAKISDNNSDSTKTAGISEQSPAVINTDDIEAKAEKPKNDKMVFQNKYVIFEPEEDLSKLNNAVSVQKAETAEPVQTPGENNRSASLLNSNESDYKKKKKSSTPEFKKVYYKPKKNKIAESRSQKKWRIRK